MEINIICKEKGHDFVDEGGICINWTGAIGMRICKRCLATAKYGYNKKGDVVEILWIKKQGKKHHSLNKEAILEFGNYEDRMLICKHSYNKTWLGFIKCKYCGKHK